jgi:hypothetical protein
MKSVWVYLLYAQLQMTAREPVLNLKYHKYGLSKASGTAMSAVVCACDTYQFKLMRNK